MSGLVSEVDKYGNCSNCGGVHFGTGNVCVEKQDFPKPPVKRICEHHALRKVRDNRHTFNAYICGNCAQMFEVTEHMQPLPDKPEPLSKKVPWGKRPRQA